MVLNRNKGKLDAVLESHGLKPAFEADNQDKLQTFFGFGETEFLENTENYEVSSLKYIKFDIFDVPSDKTNQLTNLEVCLELIEALKPLKDSLGQSRDYITAKNFLINSQNRLTKIADTTIKEAIESNAKLFTRHYLKNLGATLNPLLIEPKVSLDKLSLMANSLNHELGAPIKSIGLNDIEEILKCISEIFSEIKLPKKVYEPIALINELNYLVGGGAITSGCKALRDSKNWDQNQLGKAYFQHNKADKTNSYIIHYITNWSNSKEITLLPYSEAEQILDKFGVYPALFHLILAVHFYRQSDPLSANLRLKGTDLIKDLGLDKRTDLTKEEKLNRVLETVTAVRSLVITAKWASTIKVQKGKKLVEKEVYLEVMPSIMWDISPLKITEKDLFGNEQLIDLDIRVKAGTWLGHFFNQSGREMGVALYNFATLSRKILNLDPYHEELALRIALLQSTMDYRQYYTVEQWLVENLLGAKDRISKAKSNQTVRKDLTNLWDQTLLALERVGFTVHYDIATYAENLRPESSRKPRNYLDKLLLAKIKLTPETLGKPQSVIDVKSEEIKQVLQITEKVYSGQELKSKREALGITQPMIAKYLRKNKMYVSRIEKTENLSKEKYNEILDAINYINKYKAKFE